MIEFYSLSPSVVESMPIIPAREYKYKWYARAVEELRNKSNLNSVARCPGIIDVNSRGWVQRTYQDIWIETTEDNKRFIRAREEINQKALPMGDKMYNYVNFHGPGTLAHFREGHDHAMDTIIKIQSPWRVKIPDGYTLLAMPIPYPDDQRFTAAHGTLKGEIWLNVQLFWHVKPGGIQHIPKGTPVQQYILIKDEDVQYNIRAHNSMDQI